MATLYCMPAASAPEPGAIERHVLAALSPRIDNVTAAAAHVGVSASQLSRYLAGVRPIRLTEFVRLCEYVGLDPAVLLRAAEDAAESDS